MTLYKGSQQIRDTEDYGVYHGSDPIAAIYKGSERVYMYHRSLTYNAQDNFQTYVVPAWVSKIQVDCVGAQGRQRGSVASGKGGRVQCILNVTAGQTLYLRVSPFPQSDTVGNILGYNASDIRTNNAGLMDLASLQSRLVVAGGGGTAWSGQNYNGYGGNGGGLTGARGQSIDNGGGGAGGTQTAGGAGGRGQGTSITNGTRGAFGAASVSSNTSWRYLGGGGWYSGGGGGSGAYVTTASGGGGGGSSYTHPDLCTNVTHTQGYRTGAGYITITEIG